MASTIGNALRWVGRRLKSPAGMMLVGVYFIIASVVMVIAAGVFMFAAPFLTPMLAPLLGFAITIGSLIIIIGWLRYFYRAVIVMWK